MNQKFRHLVEALDPHLKQLLAMEPARVNALPHRMPRKGIYLFSEGAKNLYVGRSDHLRTRLLRHGKSSSSRGEARFAYQVARNECGGASREQEAKDRALDEDPRVASAFVAAKERIRTALDVRWIQADDAPLRALLQIYAQVALETRFSGLENR